MAKSVINKKSILKFCKDKRVQWVFASLLFLIILFSSVSLRVSNLEILKDQTTGKYLPSDPDALYEYRVAETILNTGDISGIDTMRNPGMNLGYAQEMLPKVLAGAYKVLNSLNPSLTLDKIDVLYPVVAFGIGLIIFFLLCLYLSKSKSLAVIASALLAYSPSYLSRTGAGVSSHESLGMVFMFLAFLVFILSLNYYKKNYKLTIAAGILTGISLALSFFSWGGASNFVLMVFPIASLFHYFFNIDDKNLKEKEKFLLFSIIWILVSILSMPLMSYDFMAIGSRLLSNYGILVPIMILFTAVDFSFQRFYKKIGEKKLRVLYSLASTVLLGILGLIVIGKNPITLLQDVYFQLLFPMGVGRVGLTVAYYAQPYVSDLIGQYTQLVFTLFFIGMIVIGMEISRNISSLKHKFGFVLAWIIAISGMLFSRLSQTSIFNGTNFISELVYIISFGIFAVYFVWLYNKDKFKMDSRSIFLFSWMIVMLISTRSAVRVLFVIYTFVAFAIAFLIVKSYQYAKSSKDSTLKAILYLVSILSLILGFYVLFGNPLVANSYGYYQVTAYTAANSGPIANVQWQDAMEWTRNNTSPDSVFLHWWDYGYLVQTMANRTTVLDGGNAVAYWNHLMGRYVLTTPKPETALSFMKSHNVSYLLIDPTDFGKYGAYSKIGGNATNDRYSAPTNVVIDSKQTQETSNGTKRIYQGSTFVDEDINFNGIFLPGPTFDNLTGSVSYKSYFIGITLQARQNKTDVSFEQPKAVFLYNNKQYQVPMRYIFYDGQMLDFKTGINSTLMLIPNIQQDSTGQIKIDKFGAGIYLSPRVQEGLFARLYLMNDPLKQYSSITLAQTESDMVVKLLRQQGIDLGEFVYFNGMRAPLKIWKVDYPENVLTNEMFVSIPSGWNQIEGPWAPLDYVPLVK